MRCSGRRPRSQRQDLSDPSRLRIGGWRTNKCGAWDQGCEMSQHAQLSIDTGMKVFFCDPRSPWQRGTNENTNGPLRQYFPKGTDLSEYRASELNAVTFALNTRLRKTLGWRMPAEAFSELMRSAKAAAG